VHFILLISLLALFPGQQPAHKQSDEIKEDELAQYLAKQNDCQPDQIYFWSTEEHDFLGVGYDQTIVVASTCMTGTAGPDVHSVYTRDEKGELKELGMEALDWNKYSVLFGNSNSSFSIENDLLVDSYHDTSDRDNPLTVKYKWNAEKQKFVIVQVDAAKPFTTSYDCTKATDTAQAICYVETLADLDVELANVYKAYLHTLDAESRKRAVEDERHWLAERDRSCTIYKGWVDCLEESYKKRTAELQKLTETAKKASESRPAKQL
jgi:uncharacterized protein YecT (DUF1311 family)